MYLYKRGKFTYKSDLEKKMFINFWSSVSHYNLKRENKSIQKSRDFRLSVINCKIDLQIHNATKK